MNKQFRYSLAITSYARHKIMSSGQADDVVNWNVENCPCKSYILMCYVYTKILLEHIKGKDIWNLIYQTRIIIYKTNGNQQKGCTNRNNEQGIMNTFSATHFLQENKETNECSIMYLGEIKQRKVGTYIYSTWTILNNKIGLRRNVDYISVYSFVLIESSTCSQRNMLKLHIIINKGQISRNSFSQTS